LKHISSPFIKEFCSASAAMDMYSLLSWSNEIPHCLVIVRAQMKENSYCLRVVNTLAGAARDMCSTPSWESRIIHSIHCRFNGSCKLL